MAQASSGADTVTARELAELADVPYSTIDHWTDKGLLDFQRLDGRTRVYPEEENLRRCRFIKKMQRRSEGFSLASIKGMIGRSEHRLDG